MASTSGCRVAGAQRAGPRSKGASHLLSQRDRVCSDTGSVRNVANVEIVIGSVSEQHSPGIDSRLLLFRADPWRLLAYAWVFGEAVGRRVSGLGDLATEGLDGDCVGFGAAATAGVEAVGRGYLVGR